MASQISRLFFIDQRIRTAGKVTLKNIMQKGEVSSATAKRDIETLRYTLQAPIVYDKKLRAYTYTMEFPLLNFAGEQLFLFYVFARGLLQNSNYIPLTAEYTREIISKKIKEILPADYRSVSEDFIYTNSDYEKVDFEILAVIIKSLVEKRQCRLFYFTKGKELSERKIEPLKVICYGTKWYIAAYCHKRKGIRFFSFSRIDKLELLDEKFTSGESVTDIEQLINNSFGIAKSSEIKTAVIKFYEPSSYFVSKQIWHNEQTIKEYKRNNEQILELQLPYAKPEELIGRVLKYGATAEILKPMSLKKLWLKEIEGMWTKYMRPL